uniref:Uncharacterized protein n=1 Tax=Caenorhabditis japonica TaxID=281687 RepID=A0A8R1IBM9_CAEJA
IAATSKLREMAYCQVAAFQVDLEKFLDDVRNGIYPLTAFAPLAHQPSTTLRAYSNTFQTNPQPLFTMQTDTSAPSSTHPSANSTITTEPSGGNTATSGLTHPNGAAVNINGSGSIGKSASPETSIDKKATETVTETIETEAQGGPSGTVGPSGGKDVGGSPTPEEDEETGERDMRLENRHVLEINVHIENEEMSIVLLLEDQMHRQLTTSLHKLDTPDSLTENLVSHGFVCQLDSEDVEKAIAAAFDIRATRMAEGNQDEESETTSLREVEPEVVVVVPVENGKSSPTPPKAIAVDPAVSPESTKTTTTTTIKSNNNTSSI